MLISAHRIATHASFLFHPRYTLPHSRGLGAWSANAVRLPPARPPRPGPDLSRSPSIYYPLADLVTPLFCRLDVPPSSRRDTMIRRRWRVFVIPFGTTYVHRTVWLKVKKIPLLSNLPEVLQGLLEKPLYSQASSSSHYTSPVELASRFAPNKSSHACVSVFLFRLWSCGIGDRQSVQC